MRRWMGYLPYYLLLFAASYALRYPWLLGTVAVVWLVRRWLPDPVLFFRHPRHLPAPRDLAKICLTKRRPRRALALLEEARQRDPESAELLLLTGIAQLEAG